MSLRTDHVSYTWQFRGGECLALNDFSAEFPTGQTHVICGPSGSGKSTLGLLLAGLILPDTGGILFDDVALQHRRSEIAFVFQFPEDIFFEDTLGDEMAGLARSDGSLDLHWFEKLGIPFEQLSTSHPFELSAGYRRLAATAMQLARTPRLLILDEPTIGLDWRFHARMLTALRQWVAEDRTLIVITHDLDVLRELGGSAWVLDSGTLAWSGQSEILLQDLKLLSQFGLFAD